MTMALLEFPADLPIPQELPTQSAERRVLSPDGGLFEVRVGQTDRKAYEDYAFPPYSPTQAEALDYFWRVTLNKGGKWFSTATGRHWPRPEGWIAATRRFVGPPGWEYIHTGKSEGGYWRVTGVFEVRGVGELPATEDPSAWNPLDIISGGGGDPPMCLDLTQSNRVATRNTRAENYESGVRGALSHGGVPGVRWYTEMLIISTGNGADPSDNQNMQVGLIDDFVANILSRVPYPGGGSPDSQIATGVGGNFLLPSTRFDGVVWSSYPIAVSSPGGFGFQPPPGSRVGIDWLVGTSITLTLDGGNGLVCPFTYAGQMFPYFSAGSTNSNGAAPLPSSGESVLICNGRRQQLYRPGGVKYWG